MAVPLFLALLLRFNAAAAPGDFPAPTEELANAAWRERGLGFAESSVVLRDPVDRAIAAWEAALAQRPDDLALRFRLIEALYFRGHFAARDAEESQQDADRALALAEQTLERAVAAAGGAEHLADLPVERQAELERGLEHAAEGHFWCAISWGVWAMEHGNLAAARRNVAGRIRRHAEVLVALDELYADAGGLRLLGRLHTATPKVPLVTGWIDRRHGIELLRRARAISGRDARNPLFLAEALLAHQPEGRAEALSLLREVAARVPDARYLVEETETIARARSLLEREAGR